MPPVGTHANGSLPFFLLGPSSSMSFLFTALLVVATSPVAATFTQSLQGYDSAVHASWPRRFFRGTQGPVDKALHEERSVFTTLANLIDAGVKKMPATAEILLPQGRGSTPRKVQPARPVVDDAMLHAAQDKDDWRRSAKYALLQAAHRADAALQVHWHPAKTAATGDPTHDISSEQVLGFTMWDTPTFGNMNEMIVHEKHVATIESVHNAFAELCDPNVAPTQAETSLLWSMLLWNVAKRSSKAAHKQNLMVQAERYVSFDLRHLAQNPTIWKQWERLAKPLQTNVLNFLLNVHYQRWVRMYNLFKRFRPDQKVAALTSNRSPRGIANDGARSPAAVTAVYPSVGTKRRKRPVNGQARPTSLALKQARMHSATAFRPQAVAPPTGAYHSVVPIRSGLYVGGPSTAVAPSQQSRMHHLMAWTRPSSAKASDDVETALSLGGIYAKSPYKAPAVP